MTTPGEQLRRAALQVWERSTQLYDTDDGHSHHLVGFTVPFDTMMELGRAIAVCNLGDLNRELEALAELHAEGQRPPLRAV